MTDYLITAIVIALLLPGLLMVLFPQVLDRLERALNRPVGERPVFSLRAGIPGERQAEAILNRPVLGRAVYWDRWIRRRPRAFGIALVAAAALCLAAVVA